MNVRALQPGEGARRAPAPGMVPGCPGAPPELALGASREGEQEQGWAPWFPSCQDCHQPRPGAGVLRRPEPGQGWERGSHRKPWPDPSLLLLQVRCCCSALGNRLRTDDERPAELPAGPLRAV